MRLGVGSYLQGGLLVLAGKVCALGTGKAGRRQGPSEPSLQTGMHQRLCPVPLQQVPLCICPGNWSHCLGIFSMPKYDPDNQIYLIWSKQCFLFSSLPFPGQWQWHAAHRGSSLGSPWRPLSQSRPSPCSPRTALHHCTCSVGIKNELNWD